nr:LacI family DNA-binding transcriptional regulator [Massilistercora timonensis]
MNIHDIAKLAGVSVSTVSKVMNGKDKDISEKTKQRVLKVIEEEQYIPYFKFREKEGLKSHLIGLVMKKDNREGEKIIRSAQKAAAQMGYGLLVQFADGSDEMQECVNDLQKKKIAGLILDSEKLINTRQEPHC